MGDTKIELESITEETLNLLENLGFTVNRRKSCLTPTQKVDYLGTVTDTCSFTFSLPDDKQLKIKEKCKEILKREVVPIRCLSSLIGSLDWATITVPFARAHFRYLQQVRSEGLRKFGYQNALVTLTLKAKLEVF